MFWKLVLNIFTDSVDCRALSVIFHLWSVTKVRLLFSVVNESPYAILLAYIARGVQQKWPKIIYERDIWEFYREPIPPYVRYIPFGDSSLNTKYKVLDDVA